MVQTNETNWEFILFTSRQWMMMIQLLLIFIFPTLRMLELYWVRVWWLLENSLDFHFLSIFFLQADRNGLQMCSPNLYIPSSLFKLLENAEIGIKAKIWPMSTVRQGEVLIFALFCNDQQTWLAGFTQLPNHAKTMQRIFSTAGLIFYSLHKMAYSRTEPWVTVAIPYH